VEHFSSLLLLPENTNEKNLDKKEAFGGNKTFTLDG